MNRVAMFAICLILVCGCGDLMPHKNTKGDLRSFTLYPIGKVAKSDGRTYLVIEKQFERGLEGLEMFDEVTVVYWFDRNDTAEKRSILRVHPQGDANNPPRGVFSTHAPVRPNLIAISRCKIIAVQENIIEIDNIDAYPDSPILDLKN